MPRGIVNGMVELAGTAKQIAWAEKIRIDFLNAFKEEDGYYLLEEFADWIKSTKGDAKWWIDNRGDNYALYALLMAEYNDLPEADMANLVKNLGTSAPAKAEPEPKPVPELKEIEVSYRDYKNKYSKFKSVAGSYNAKAKTIKVMVPADFDMPTDEVPAKPEWLSVNINDNLVEVTTAKSVKIAIPHKSKYDGYSFWHPAKLIHEGRHSAAISLSYTPDFEFHLKQYGKGRYNSRDVLDEVTITAAEFAEVFGIIDGNATAPAEKPLIHTPETLQPEETVVPEELRDVV